MISLAQRLIQLQEQHEVPNVQLAKAVGVHPITVARWRNGSNMKVSDCAALAQFFSISLEGLFKDVDGNILED